MNLYKIENDTLVLAPKSIILDSGETILNFDLVAKEYGYKELISETPPNFNDEFQMLKEKYIENNDHILKTWEVVDILSIEDYKQKMIDSFNVLCNKTILDGFTSLGYRFSFDFEAQINFTQQLLVINGVQSVYWKTEDSGVKNFTVDEFKRIVNDAQAHKLRNIQKYWQIKETILNATTIEEIASIVW